jgi:hypothetical protein
LEKKSMSATVNAAPRKERPNPYQHARDMAELAWEKYPERLRQIQERRTYVRDTCFKDESAWATMHEWDTKLQTQMLDWLLHETEPRESPSPHKQGPHARQSAHGQTRKNRHQHTAQQRIIIEKAASDSMTRTLSHLDTLYWIDGSALGDCQVSRVLKWLSKEDKFHATLGRRIEYVRRLIEGLAPTDIIREKVKPARADQLYKEVFGE